MDDAARGTAPASALADGHRGRFFDHGTLTWPPGLASGVAFGSIIIAVAGFSGGIVTLGTAGLVALGLAIGFTGRMRARLLLALALWSAHAALATASVALGASGVEALLPPVYVLMALAAGQGVAVTLSILHYRPGGDASPQVAEVAGRTRTSH